MSAPKRIQLRRTKGWRKPAGTIVVSRPSVFGNPFVVGDTATVSVGTDTQDVVIWSDLAVACYRELMTDRLTVNDPDDPEDVEFVQAWRTRVEKLAGHDLACWCSLDQPCHGDVLLDLANRGGT